MFLVHSSSLELPEALTLSYLNREWTIGWSLRQWLNLSGGWFQELRCTSFWTKATSHTSASATSATGRYSPPSLASHRALSTLRRNPAAMWLQSLPKKQQHQTISQSRNKEHQAWPDKDQFSGPALQQYRYQKLLLLLNTIPHRQTGFSSLPMGQGLHQVD